MPPNRVRHPGGGRNSAVTPDPQLVLALLALVEPDERWGPDVAAAVDDYVAAAPGDELTRRGHRVSTPTVGNLPVGQGFSLQTPCQVRFDTRPVGRSPSEQPDLQLVSSSGLLERTGDGDGLTGRQVGGLGDEPCIGVGFL